MTDTTIALNRFGLGARPGDGVPDDPRGWLLGQFARYDPRPTAFAAVPPAADAIALLATAYAERKDLRAQQAAGTPPPVAAGRAIAPGAAVAAVSAMPPSAPTIPGRAPAPAMPPPPPDNPFQPVRAAFVAGVGARCASALATDTPFVEHLVHFWANHFALSADKQEVIALAGAYELEAIRPHVLGSFADMLYAVERHPAMLLYLDQDQSVGPNSAAVARQKVNPHPNPHRRGLNENLAREILELHTLGVRSGYTQADVTEFARALTGWTVAGIRANGNLRGYPPGAAFVPRLHEPGARTIMGKTYPGSGADTGADSGAGNTGDQAGLVLADLAVHPATARHIATKLARHFCADAPPPALVARLDRAFLASGGDLPTVYRALIASPEPWAAPPRFRSPWAWGLAALRATGARDPDPRAANGLFDQLGQPVWRPGSPAGWDDTSASFAAPDALLLRVEAAGRLASRAGALNNPGRAGAPADRRGAGAPDTPAARYPAASYPIGADTADATPRNRAGAIAGLAPTIATAAPLDARALAPALFPGALSDATRTALANAENGAQALALLLASPEMLRS